MSEKLKYWSSSENMPFTTIDTIVVGTRQELTEAEKIMFFSTSLREKSIDTHEVEKLSRKYIPNLKVGGIRAINNYQLDHGLPKTGKIGPETYYEMKAGEVLTQAKLNVETQGISNNTQIEILNVLKNGSCGINYTNLLGFIGNFRNNPTPVGKDYSIFFQNLDKFMNNPNLNPSIPTQATVKKTMNASNGQGGTVGGDIADAILGKKDWSDIMTPNRSGNAKIGLVLGFIFFGGKIPGLNKIPGTGSWYGRIGLLLVGGLLGVDDFFGKLTKAGLDKVGEADNKVGNSSGTNSSAPSSVSSSNDKTKSHEDIFDNIFNGVDRLSKFNYTEKNTNQVIDFEPELWGIAVDYENNKSNPNKSIPEAKFKSIMFDVFQDENFLFADIEKIDSFKYNDLSKASGFTEADFERFKKYFLGSIKAKGKQRLGDFIFKKVKVVDYSDKDLAKDSDKSLAIKRELDKIKSESDGSPIYKLVINDIVKQIRDTDPYWGSFSELVKINLDKYNVKGGPVNVSINNIARLLKEDYNLRYTQNNTQQVAPSQGNTQQVASSQGNTPPNLMGVRQPIVDTPQVVPSQGNINFQQVATDYGISSIPGDFTTINHNELESTNLVFEWYDGEKKETYTLETFVSSLENQISTLPEVNIRGRNQKLEKNPVLDNFRSPANALEFFNSIKLLKSGTLFNIINAKLQGTGNTEAIEMNNRFQRDLVLLENYFYNIYNKMKGSNS